MGFLQIQNGVSIADSVAVYDSSYRTRQPTPVAKNGQVHPPFGAAVGQAVFGHGISGCGTVA
ncbi:hypothetical protein CCHOA_04240 [Corynebacterium choanae]|uniref:Uncharacterized protein n=1 Tax=Corynebacterium choanae TaxID=1862358 RepID=A0A3G6J5E1_9CORY|nr:hypothetical protein CCHOA_04240 [Corynebacterium choanae]